MKPIEILVPDGRKVQLVMADGILLPPPVWCRKLEGMDYEIYSYSNPLGYEPKQITIEFESNR